MALLYLFVSKIANLILLYPVFGSLYFGYKTLYNSRNQLFYL